MALRGVIVVAAVCLVAISLMGSKDADAALNVPRASGTAQGALVLQIHGCHPYWEQGWSNALHRYLVHRHGRNCRPEAYGDYDDHHWGRGKRDYDDRHWRGAPPGWRRYPRAPW